MAPPKFYQPPIYFKSCARCPGDVRLVVEADSSELRCYQCGWRYEVTSDTSSAGVQMSMAIVRSA